MNSHIRFLIKIIVLRKLKNRGGHEINLFYETDFSVVTAFKKVVPEESEEE